MKPEESRYHLSPVQHIIVVVIAVLLICIIGIVYSGDVVKLQTIVAGLIAAIIVLIGIWLNVYLSKEATSQRGKELTLTELDKLRTALSRERDKLIKAFEYDKYGVNEVIPEIVIFKSIGELDADGSPIKEKNLYILSNTEEAKTLIVAITSSLNECEKIAYGIHNDIYDEKIVMELAKSMLVKMYFNFYPYIRNLNNEAYYSELRNNVVCLYCKIKHDLEKKNTCPIRSEEQPCPSN